MRKSNDELFTTARALTAALGIMALVPATVSADSHMSGMVAQGKKIAFDRSSGNCIACHMMDDGESPGNIGPPLIAMQARYPDKAKLRDQLWDATVSNPQSPMPPFGSHGILSAEDIDKLVEYIWTL